MALAPLMRFERLATDCALGHGVSFVPNDDGLLGGHHIQTHPYTFFRNFSTRKTAGHQALLATLSNRRRDHSGDSKLRTCLPDKTPKFNGEDASDDGRSVLSSREVLSAFYFESETENLHP